MWLETHVVGYRISNWGFFRNALVLITLECFDVRQRSHPEGCMIGLDKLEIMAISKSLVLGIRPIGQRFKSRIRWLFQV